MDEKFGSLIGAMAIGLGRDTVPVLFSSRKRCMAATFGNGLPLFCSFQYAIALAASLMSVRSCGIPVMLSKYAKKRDKKTVDGFDGNRGNCRNGRRCNGRH